MTEEHKGLPVVGYLPQSDDKVAMVNINKELEERSLRRIEWFEIENSRALDTYQAANNTFIVSKSDFKYPHDPEMLKDAKMQIKQAWMWANRAVFQPARVKLPEDDNG